MNDAFVEFCRERNRLEFGILNERYYLNFRLCYFQELVSGKCLWSILDLSEGIRKANEIKQS